MDKIAFALIGALIGGAAAFAICWSGKKEEYPDYNLILKKLNNMAKSVAEVKAQLELQGTALDSIGTNVTGIGDDVTAMKAKIEELKAGGDAAVAAALDELTPFIDSASAKIDTIGATTASLDASTDPSNL